MPRLSGVVSEHLFAAVDAWRELQHKRKPGAKWTRQGAIEYLSLVALCEIRNCDPEIRKALAAVKGIPWDAYEIRQDD